MVWRVSPVVLHNEEVQRKVMHEMAGPRMSGKGKGDTYTWIPNHLADANLRVSPQSFLAAIRFAAEDTDTRAPEYRYALHPESIRRGVRKASVIRSAELQDDYHRLESVLGAFQGLTVPFGRDDVRAKWREAHVLERLSAADQVNASPPRFAQGEEGLLFDLEELGIFQRMKDGRRINIPDVYRVAFGLGRIGLHFLRVFIL